MLQFFGFEEIPLFAAIGKMPFKDVDSLSDDAAPPANPSTPVKPTKAKAKAKGKAKGKPSPKPKSKASPKPRVGKGRTILEKMKREEPPTEPPNVLPTVTSPEVKKRGRPPKAEPKSGPVFKRPAAGGSKAGKGAGKDAGTPKKRPASAELSVCKYRYKANGTWGFKIGKKEVLRVPLFALVFCLGNSKEKHDGNIWVFPKIGIPQNRWFIKPP